MSILKGPPIHSYDLGFDKIDFIQELSDSCISELLKNVGGDKGFAGWVHTHHSGIVMLGKI